MRLSLLSALLCSAVLILTAPNQVEASRAIRSARSIGTPATTTSVPAPAAVPASHPHPHPHPHIKKHTANLIPIDSISFVQPRKTDPEDWFGLQFAFDNLPTTAAASGSAYTYVLTVHPLNQTITSSASPISLSKTDFDKWQIPLPPCHGEGKGMGMNMGMGSGSSGMGMKMGRGHPSAPSTSTSAVTPSAPHPSHVHRPHAVRNLWFTLSVTDSATGQPILTSDELEAEIQHQGKWNYNLPCSKTPPSAALTGPAPVTHSAEASFDSADAWGAFGISANGDRHDYQLKDYGWQYGQNKRAVWNAINANGMDWSSARVTMAIAMLETGDMGPWSHDSSKDWQGDSKNVSLFNMNVGFLKYIGSQYANNPDALNGPNALNAAVAQIFQGMKRLGMDGFLNFHRGGQTAYQDGKSYGAYDYRNTISSMVQAMANDQNLLTDQRRIEISLYGV